jgi:two-component system, sensor histidine kinase PdtaS
MTPVQASNILLNLGELIPECPGVADSALFYFQDALGLISQCKNGDRKIIDDCRFTIIGNMGIVHLQMGQLELAELELTEAKQFFKQTGDFYRKTVYRSELGKLYLLLGDTIKGTSLINESLETAITANLKEQIRDFSLQLSTLYEERGQIYPAFNLYKQYKLYDDSLKNVETIRLMEQQQSHFELTKKEEEIEVLNKINKLQRRLAFILSASIFMFIVLAAVLFIANRRIKSVNTELTQQKMLVEQREKEKALLLRELNHRVKNNLQMVSSLLNLHSRQLKDHPAAEALMAGRYRVEALTLIHQKLYRDDVDTKIDLKDYIEELSKNLVMNFGPDFILDLKLNPLVMKVDKAIPLGLIINELLTNSLKYGGKNNSNPRLSIGILIDNNDAIITIADNGQGLPADFDLAKSTSFGLKLVNSLVRQLGGSIACHSENGTSWALTLNKEKIS